MAEVTDELNTAFAGLVQECGETATLLGSADTWSALPTTDERVTEACARARDEIANSSWSCVYDPDGETLECSTEAMGSEGASESVERLLGSCLAALSMGDSVYSCLVQPAIHEESGSCGGCLEDLAAEVTAYGSIFEKVEGVCADVIASAS